ncbi:hypothetical protein GCM10027562_13150 [Arthrobacter pigmenti]
MLLPQLDSNQQPFDYWSDLGTRSFLAAYSFLVAAANQANAGDASGAGKEQG